MAHSCEKKRRWQQKDNQDVLVGFASYDLFYRIEMQSKPKEYKDFVDGQGAWKWSTDQTLLNWWIKKEKMNIKHMNWKWNGLFHGIRDDKVKEAHFVHFFLKDKLPNRGENVEELMKYVNN